ncbi:MAG: XisI protein [Blastocatellia bacterium]|nr:XisI protein [Blastocatellia bacterium]
MDKLKEYAELLKRILTEQVELCRRQPVPDVETFLVINEEQGDYIWMNVGWQNEERVCGMTVYVRIRNGKFWIEEDWTEDGIATDLVREGVPKEDIVLAFHDPETRKDTDFAAA